MEFPELGKQCSEATCKRLDFLPMKCDACTKIFCNDHFQYLSHSCNEMYKKDNQVPVCPLCNKPIPVKKGQVADVVVGQHIDTDCQSDPAQERRKVYTNKCNYKGCKQKELIPVKCDKCHKNYCLRHRHETDHSCQGFQDTATAMSKTGAAAIQRYQKGASSKPTTSTQPQRGMLSMLGYELNQERQARTARASPSQPTRGHAHQGSSRGQPVGAYQAGLSESEAMAQALQMSLADTQPKPVSDHISNQSQEDEDLALAQAIAASEEEAARGQLQKKESSCSLS